MLKLKLQIMKTTPSLLSSHRLIFGTLFVLFLGLASALHAGPGPQYWESLRKKSQFEQLKKGDKVAYICNECKTVSEITVESHDHAMELCKEGASVTCPSCKKQSKIIVKRQRNDPPVREEVTYVNDKGEECAFIAKVPDKK